MTAPSPAAPGQPSPPSRRALHTSLSATMMVGHLCALYDRGVFEAARLMSNLITQLIVRRKANTPLLAQLGDLDRFPVFVDTRLRAHHLPPGDDGVSPLVRRMFGLTADMRPRAMWIPAMCRPPYPSGPVHNGVSMAPETARALAEAPPTFDVLGVAEWLDEPVIPTAEGMLSRGQLVAAVRDQDGGAHSDPDVTLEKSRKYVELVDSFPISRESEINVAGQITRVDKLLSPVTLPLLRQIAHELLSAIYSQSDASTFGAFPSLVSRFDPAGALADRFVRARGLPDARHGVRARAHGAEAAAPGELRRRS